MILLFFVWNWFLFMRQIGEVVNGPGSLNDRPTLNGQHYDYGNYFCVLRKADSYTYLCKSLCINHHMVWYWVHISVFDVDIGDGMPIRKLPYNREGQPSRWWWHWNCLHGIVEGPIYLIIWFAVDRQPVCGGWSMALAGGASNGISRADCAIYPAEHRTEYSYK